MTPSATTPQRRFAASWRHHPGPRRQRGGDMPPDLDTRHIGRRVLEIAVIVAVVIAAIVALPGLGELRDRFSEAQPGWIALAFALEAASCLSFVAAFRGTYCRRMSWRFSYQIAMAEQAANVLLPTGGAGGLALGAWALQRGGMSTAHIARRTVAFFLITSSVNFAVAAVTGPLVALGVLPGHVGLALALVPAGLALLVMTGVTLLPRVLPAGGTPPEGRVRHALWTASGALSHGIGDAIALVRSGRPSIVGGAVGYMAFDAAALAAAFHAFGGAPPVGTFLMAYVIGQLGGLVPLPGGLGGTDGGLVGAFALFGSGASAAAAAVLAYRAFQLGLPVVLGVLGFHSLQRTLRRSTAPAALCEPLAETQATISR